MKNLKPPVSLCISTCQTPYLTFSSADGSEGAPSKWRRKRDPRHQRRIRQRRRRPLQRRLGRLLFLRQEAGMSLPLHLASGSILIPGYNAHKWDTDREYWDHLKTDLISDKDLTSVDLTSRLQSIITSTKIAHVFDRSISSLPDSADRAATQPTPATCRPATSCWTTGRPPRRPSRRRSMTSSSTTAFPQSDSLSVRTKTAMAGKT